MPDNLATLGAHLRATRIKRGLLQAEVADRIGVDKASIWKWENNRTKPPITQQGAICSFIGYDPFNLARTLPERMLKFRRINGLRMSEAAALAKVDPSSWGAWETGRRKPTRPSEFKLLELLTRVERPGS